MKEAKTYQQMVLPAALDISTIKAVASEFASMRGSPIQVDASHVTRIGGLGLQVLLAVQQAWNAEGTSIQFVNRSEGFERDIALLGNPLETES